MAEAGLSIGSSIYEFLLFAGFKREDPGALGKYLNSKKATRILLSIQYHLSIDVIKY